MKKILYVEDNKDTADAIRILLSSAGYTVDIAANGRDGLKRAAAGKYDLYLLDLMLPDMSGWDIFEKLREKQANAKFAFLSAIPVSNERMTELRFAGVSDYMTKPISKDDLLKRVKKILA